MIRQISWAALFVISIGTISLAVLFGCDQPDSKMVDFADESSLDDSITASEILSTVVAQYSEAKSYQDNAVLYLTYRLNERAIQEPHPWSIAWDRSGRMAADLFNAKIRCDGQQLSCYVFDIETGNVDNQHVLIPDGQFHDLTQDPIARYFVFGASELPLHETDVKSNWLLPPMIGLFEDAFLPGWLKIAPATFNRADLARMADDDSIGMDCYVLQVHDNGRKYRIWIDKNSGLIQQINLPLEYLDSQILASQDITKLQFFVRFHDARLNEPVTVEATSIQKRTAATTVRNFVTLPQSLPCERVGEVVSDLALKTADGKKLAADEIRSDASAILWIGGIDSSTEIKKFLMLSKNKPVDASSKFAIVYSDDLLANPGSSRFEPVKSFTETVSNSGVSTYYDPQLAVSRLLEIKTVPAVLIFDNENRIQFAKALDSEQWGKEVEVALTRVAKGEDVASEMKIEYQKFLDDYHRQLIVAGSPNTGDDVGVANSIAELKLKEPTNWSFDSLKNPGNIHIPQRAKNESQSQTDSQKILVVDGWQTVVELDRKGALQKTNHLTLPKGTAINRIRSARNLDGELFFAVFSLLGKQVFVFDENWKQVAKYPGDEIGNEHAGITECQFANSGDAMNLYVSFFDFNGIKEFDLQSLKSKSISQRACKSFCKTGPNGESLFSLSNDKLYLNSVSIEWLEHWKCVALRPLAETESCVAIAKDKFDQWMLFCLDSKGNKIWAQSIGSQYFENEIDSTSICISGDKTWVSVASPNGKIVAVEARTGRAIGISSNIPLSGFSFGQFGDEDEIIVSNGKRVANYKLESGSASNRIIPVSNAAVR